MGSINNSSAWNSLNSSVWAVVHHGFFMYDTIAQTKHWEPVFLLTEYDGPEFLLSMYGNSYVSRSASNYTGLDTVVEVCQLVSPDVKLLYPAVHLVYFNQGADYFIGLDRIFQNNVTSHHLSPRHRVDTVWSTPQHRYQKEYLEEFLSATASSVVPYVWSPYIYESRFTGKYHYKRGTSSRLGVYETNRGMYKTSLIPMLAVERLHRTLAVNYVDVGALGKFNTEAFRNNVMSRFKAPWYGSIELSNIPETWIENEIGTVVSHQIRCELNYLYLEALYSGMALVHNSPMLKDCGYYYHGENVVEASNALQRAMYEHDDTTRNDSKCLERFSTHNATNIVWYERLLNATLTPKRKVTVVVSSFKQPACLDAQIKIWQACPLVHSVRVNWFEGNVGNMSSTVIYDSMPDKISHRFMPRDFETEAVFSVDVDTMYSCRTLYKLYEIWQQDTSVMVGMHPRHLKYNETDEWLSPYKKPWTRNIILPTKGSLQHRDAFSAYFQPQYDNLRRLVDTYTTGEDFLMSFVHAKHLNPKFHVLCVELTDTCHRTCTENSVPTLLARSGHHRVKVLNALFDAFGNDTLLTTSGATNMTWVSKTDKLCHSLPIKPYNTGDCVNSHPLLMPSERLCDNYVKAIQLVVDNVSPKSVLEVGCSKLLNISGQYTCIEIDGDIPELPHADLLIVKDVLHHWPNGHIDMFMRQIHKFKTAVITNDMTERCGTRCRRDILFGEYEPIGLEVGISIARNMCHEPRKEMVIITNRSTAPVVPVLNRSTVPVVPTLNRSTVPVVPALNLFNWAKEHGAYIHPCLEYRDAGMYTTCRIPPNTNLTYIPPTLILTKSGSTLSDMANLADRILAMTPDHIMWPYVSSLPKTCQIPACRAVNLTEVSMLGAKRIHTDMQHNQFFNWSPEKQAVWSVIQSRTWPLGMVPITDLFNHDTHKGRKASINAHGATLASGNITYEKGDQVFDDYGLKGRWYAYINYGYIPDDVPPTCEDLRLLRIDTHSKLRAQCISNSSSTLEAMTEELVKAQEIGDLVMMKGAAQWIDNNIVWT